MDRGTIDFTQPRLLHPLGNLVILFRGLVKFFKGFWLLLLIIGFRHPEVFRTKFVWIGLLLLLVVLLVFSYLHYKNYTYHVNTDREEFIIRKGVLSKSQTIVKFANILQVDISQNVLQQVLGLYSVKLETAGTEKTEGDLYAMKQDEALALKQFLLYRIKKDPTVRDNKTVDEEAYSPDFGDNGDVLIRISTKNILLVSLLTNYRQGLALFFAFLIGLFQQISDVVEQMGWEDDYQPDVEIAQWRTWISVIVLIGVFIVFIPFVINIFRYFIRYYNFTLTKNRKGTLMMHYGLLQIKDVIFNTSRVQTVSFKQNKLLKRIGIGVMSIRQVIVDATKAMDSIIELPGVAYQERLHINDLIFEEDIYKDVVVYKPKIGLFISRTIKTTLFLIVLGGAVHVIFSVGLFLVSLGIGLSILVSGLYNYLYYKNYRLLFNSGYLIKRTSVWNEEEVIVPLKNVQGVRVSQTFWQKRSGSSDLTLITPADNVSFHFFERKIMVDISNFVLYKTAS